MATDFTRWLIRGSVAASAALALAIGGASRSQDNQTNKSDDKSAQQEARDNLQAAKEKAKEAAGQVREDARGKRETVRDDRQTVREDRGQKQQTVRDDRQTIRDDRGEKRDSIRDDRGNLRETRRELRQARRQFIVSTLRSGDLGLWMRRATGGMAVSDVSNQSVMAKAGLKEGDHIISVNGHNVTTEREFIDQLFANQDHKQPVPVVVNRGGKQETIHLLPSVLEEEYQAAETDHLSDIGIIVDHQQPGELVVQSVVPKSPAFYAGVRSGDKVIRFDGQRIAALTDFIRTLANTQPGTASLEVNRNNQPRQLDIEVPEAGGGARTALRPNFNNPPGATGQPNAQGAQPGVAPADQRPRLTPPTTQPRQ